MSFVRPTRRNFLRGVAATSLLAPFAGELLSKGPSKARAASPKRAIFVYVPDGCIPSKWHASAAGKTFTLPEMSAPLAAVQDKLTFISGLDMYSGEGTHEGGIKKVLTGVSAESLDIFLGKKLGQDTPHSAIQLGVGSNFQNGSGSMSFVSGAQVKADDDPLSAFTRIFGAAVGTDDGAAALLKRQKKSVLDAALGDLTAVKMRLGATERVKLDTHLDSLREVERRITTNALGACDISAFNAAGFANLNSDSYPKTYEKEDKFQTVGRLQMDLAALSLSCGATRVASIMFSHPVSPLRIADTGVGINNHDASHFGDPNSATAKSFITLKRWFMEEFVYLIERLDATPDGTGTLLDNTLVLLCSELGDSNAHDHKNMPFVLAGGAGGALEMGRSLQYNGKNAGKNEPHTKLLVSIANAMDVTVDSFGFTGEGSGPLPGLLR